MLVYYIISFCIYIHILYCIIFYCVVFYWIVLYYITLCDSILYVVILYFLCFIFWWYISYYIYVFNILNYILLCHIILGCAISWHSFLVMYCSTSYFVYYNIRYIYVFFAGAMSLIDTSSNMTVAKRTATGWNNHLVQSSFHNSRSCATGSILRMWGVVLYHCGVCDETKFLSSWLAKSW